MIALGAIMAQPWEGNLDHLVYFANENLSQAQFNYPTTEMEGLTMVSSLQNFRHYLLDTCYLFIYSVWVCIFNLCDLGLIFVQGSNKSIKTISPPGKPEGNVAHKVLYIVSPEIVLIGGYNTHVFES